jgi:hypothetical protein
MKKVTLLLVAIFAFGGLISAQSNKEEIELVQAALGMEKKSMVAEFIRVDAAQKDAFWKLYDEYETQRKELGKKRIDLYTKWVANYDQITNEQAEASMKEVIDLGKKTDALLLNYYNKIKKATNPVTAAQFYQVENYILTAVRNQILGELPFMEHRK